jgi:hypothetical protein
LSINNVTALFRSESSGDRGQEMARVRPCVVLFEQI